MFKRNKIFLLILIVLFSATLLSCDSQTSEENSVKENETIFDKENLEKIKVTRVVDGDTIIIDTNERVRLILL